MRTFILLLCSTAFGFSPITTFSQEKIVIEANKKVTVDEVFKIIKNQTHYHFLYPADIFVGAPKIQLLKGEIDLSNLLNQSLALNNLDFELSDNNTIVIKRNEISTNNKFIQQEIQINGVVKDANNMPIPGVNVMIKGTNTYTQTDFDGNYTIIRHGLSMDYLRTIYGIVWKKKRLNTTKKTGNFIQHVFNSFFVFKAFYKLSVESANAKSGDFAESG